MATKKNLKVSEAKKIADKLKSRLSKKTIARYKAQGQNNPQSKSYTEVADEGEKSKRIGMRWTDDGARKAGKKPNSPVSAADKEKYGGKTFKGKLKGKEGKVDRRYIYTERRVDKSDKSASVKFKDGGKVNKKTIARYQAQGQNAPQSKSYTEVADEGVKSKRIGMRWTDDGAKKAGKKPNSPVSAADKEKYGGKTFKGKLKGKEGKVDRRYIYTERRVDKSDKSASAKFKSGGTLSGRQYENYNEDIDGQKLAKRAGWRWTDDGAKRLNKNKNSVPSASDIQEYKNKTFRLKGKNRHFLDYERREDKADASPSRKYISLAGGGGVSQFDSIMKDGVISEKQINLIKRRLNADKNDSSVKEVVNYIWDEKPKLTSDQNKKGLEYLMNLWKSKMGKERVNNPFGYREQEALETFEDIQLSGFHDISMYNQRPYYVPLYIVNGKDSSFEYYIDSKGVNIVGSEGMEVSDEYAKGGGVRQTIGEHARSHGGAQSKELDGEMRAKPSGWRFYGEDNYKVPSQRHIDQQLELSPKDRDIYYEKRRDKSDYKSSRLQPSLKYGGMNEYAKGGGVGDSVKFIKGFGYWDLTKYPYGGDFKRFNGGEEGVLINGYRKYGNEIVVKLNDGRKIITQIQSIDLPNFEMKSDLLDRNKHLFEFGYAEGGETDEYAKGGGVPKEFGGRYNGVHNNIGRDVEMDRNWVAKPVGYRFTDDKAKELRVNKFKKPTPQQIKKYLGDGVYFENREDKSDLKPSNNYPSYMSGGTTDGSWVSAYARGGVERIANRDARDYAENMLPFKGANLEGKTLSNGDYVVLSYGYYPIWFYCKHEGKWYGNSTKYSVTTSKQMTQSRPTYDATMLTRNELEQRMLKASEKYAEGGVLSAIMGDTDGATMQNVGGTTFSNANLTSHMDITNPTF